MAGEARAQGGFDYERVSALVEPVVRAHGLLLADLEWMTERTGWILRVTVEGPSADGANAPAEARSPDAEADSVPPSWGVNLEDCAELSRDLSTTLDVEDLIPQRYTLEVSSPGLERKIKTFAEFRRFVGLLAKVKLTKPAPDGQRVLRGKLVAAIGGDGAAGASDRPAEGERIALVVDGKHVEVPYADVESANLVYELTTQPKKGGTAKGKREKRASKQR